MSRSTFCKTSVLLLVLALFLTCAGCKSGKEIEAQQEAKNRGILLLSQGSFSEAADAFKEALSYAKNSIDEDDYDILLYQAAALYAAGDTDGAIEAYTRLMDYNDRYEPAFLRGSVYIETGELHRGLSDYREAVARAPKDYELHISIYTNLAAQGYEDEAVSYLELALQISGDDAQNLLQRGRIYWLMEQNELAESLLTQALTAGAPSAGVYLARIRSSEGDTDGARSYLEAYRSSGSLTAEDYLLLGDTEMILGDPVAALADYDQGIAIAARDEAQPLRRGAVVALERQTRYADALSRASSYVQDYPWDGDMQHELAFLMTVSEPEAKTSESEAEDTAGEP